MLKRALAGVLIVGCAAFFTPAAQDLGAGPAFDDPGSVPGTRCAPALGETPAGGGEIPPAVGAFIDCLRATGYGTR